MRESLVFLKMLHILIVVTCLTCLIIQAAPQTLHDRIVGGGPTFIEEIPYQASLQFFSRHSCGAVIINESYVLTAAHCTNGYVIIVDSSDIC